MISRLAKIPALYRDWLRSLNQEKCQLFELHRRKGGFENTHCILKNAAIC